MSSQNLDSNHHEQQHAQHIPVIQAAQVPLHFSHSDWRPTSVAGNDLTGWSLDELPNPNATGHLVFETVNSLLQHWPNTRLRNGHTIVPGTIPEGTLLYHGTNRNELPPGPDWTSVDPEHSLFFCSDETGRGCWHLTLVTTRPLKVVYFDGTSAANTMWGSLDTQDLIAWGMSQPSRIFDERGRIKDLCQWGKDIGCRWFHILRSSSEVMLCDFTSGVTVASFLNLARVVTRRNRQLFPGGSPDSPVAFEMTLLDWSRSTIPNLAPSLVPIRAGQERWDHRVQNISSEDGLAARARVAEALTRSESGSSGVDWRALIRAIVDRYADRLELMQYLLSSQATDSETLLDFARKAQVQLRIMLAPYILVMAAPPHPSTGTEVSWAVPIFKFCATTHTSFIQSYSPSMTPSEQLILQAVQETSREICRVVTNMWASGVHAGLDSNLNTKELPDVGEVTNLMNVWRIDVNRLMAWLDWSVWVKCGPACGPEEMCYLPTWPYNFPRPPRKYPPGGPGRRPGRMLGVHEDTRALDIDSMAAEQLADWGDAEPLPDEWLKPQPRCIRRVEPYAL
ncbi:hypothetical protein BU15DRAFT_76664 [Melanogaster broomeanus]|nr:hypothetical protein BU15DRAFT_76664 [Melanogaster broomeanus]